MKKTIYSEHGRIIAETLVYIRNNAGLTQRDLAKKLGRERSFVAHCELGERRVDLAEFYWICDACGASPQKEASNLIKNMEKLFPSARINLAKSALLYGSTKAKNI